MHRASGRVHGSVHLVSDRVGGTLIFVGGLDAETMNHLVERRRAELEEPGRTTLNAARCLECFADQTLLVFRHCLAKVEPIGREVGHRDRSLDFAAHRLVAQYGESRGLTQK